MTSGIARTVLRDPNICRFFLGHFIPLLGDGIAGTALVFAVLDLTGSATCLGAVVAARTMTMLAVMPIGGIIADRGSRRRVLLIADAVRCVVHAALVASPR